MIKLPRAAKSGSDFSIVLRGWSKRILLPNLLQHMPEVTKTDVNEDLACTTMAPRWSPSAIWAGWWLGPLVAIYKIALENGVHVLVVGGEPTVLYFKHNEQRATVLEPDSK